MTREEEIEAWVQAEEDEREPWRDDFPAPVSEDDRG